ncbi:receptor-like protein kinase 7 [Quercus robur]|uniref:receptor-like protein kinase 7 n=1 Tax=Quercus robur TaxID=38942 RepID=UPI0021632E8F|nr:receptor-like protein kinase 7 [Quercus robur]
MLSNQFFQLRLVLLLLFLSFLSLISFSKSSELNSLLQFKSAVQNPDTNHVFSSWAQANSLCNFTGIACNSNGLVREINLPQQNLHGILPFDAICSLQSLDKLSLASNFLYGTITDDLKNCTSLQHLDMGWNKFSGKVPDLSPLGKLEFLNLNNSGFSGPFPWRSLENLTSLTFLSLGDNFFEPNAFPVEVFKLEKLYWLYLSNCSLTGQIPEGLGNLTQLINLELSCNQFTGEIPADIGKLKNLRQLELYSNSLTGKLPVGFGNLTSLANLDMSRNKLQGTISEVRFLTNLVSLHLYENQFTGEVPEELGEFKNLSNFSVYRNKFTGPLPQKLGSLGDFLYIDVAENFLTGPIPPDMCKNGIMIVLIVLQNRFTGGIPERYANCLSLTRVRLNNNSLSGVVPAGIWGLPNLSIFDLSINQFEGPVASNVGNAKSLAQLFLNNNHFSGELPLAISKASSLVSIKLSSNQFSGQIPETISGLKTLSNIYLDENMFSGYIPDSLGSCVSLSQINLSGNKLSGNIPASLGHLPTLNSLNLSNNELSGQIPTSLSSLTLSHLDLSNNQLIGQIPNFFSIQAFSTSFNGNPGLCSQNLKHFQPCSSGSSTRSQLGTLVSCLIAGAVILLLVLACCLCVKLRHNNLDSPLKPNSWDMKPYHILNFTEKDILDGIKNDNQIGKGGSGNVYRVELTDGKELAVKHIWISDSGEYEAEVATLSSVRHVNVVKLYCSITSEDSSLLVYEYLPNGSLWDRLHNSSGKMEMGWEVRYEIALGAARGLEYLHHGCDRPVIHRDVKSSNILLDGDWKPRIADFGLAKIVQANGGDWTHAIAGTLGYMAPEYAYTYKVNEKSDVYSFGVVLLELVMGKRPIELEFGENKDIVCWVCSKISNKESVLDLVDSTISEALKEDAIKVMRIAIHCTSKLPSLRPSMRMVVQMLKEAEPCKLT